MTSLSHLNRFILFIIFFIIPILSSAFGEDEPADIWKNQKTQNEQNNESNNEKDITIESPIISEDVQKVIIRVDNKIEDQNRSVIGIFDPDENNFNLNMWLASDGKEVKKVLKRIDKLKLSRLSEDLLFQILFTNAYSPKKNLNSEEFLKIKINWLIKKNRIEDLEVLLKKNLEVGRNPEAIKFLIDEYLSSADIKSACEKVNFIDREIRNSYLEKFTIYCLIHNDQKDEAQLNFDLMKESGFKDKFFEEKINFLLGIKNSTEQKVLDNNLFNFYLSHATIDNIQYEPNEKTDKYIWKYLSSANLIQIDNFENEEVVLTYEKAAAKNAFDSDEIFKMYLKMNFNFNQLANAKEIYKNLPKYKSRALIYQSILLSDNVEKKINLLFLLKDLFIQDQLLNVYTEELASILKSIDPNDIPKDYEELVIQNQNIDLSKKIQFNNDILHRSKIIKHFLDNNAKLTRTEKDFKSVYKKIKKNKKYFISIKDIVVLESLANDGISLPNDLDYAELASQLTVPENLQDLVRENQIGLVMLKIVEIIGEDNIGDLDSETLYFLNKILNDLNLKKIRNSILGEALPAKA